MTRKISLKRQALRSEVKHTNFFIQHNIPFAVVDHLSLTYQELFPDSKITRNFKCSRTKTPRIMNQTVGSKQINRVYERETIFFF